MKMNLALVLLMTMFSGVALGNTTSVDLDLKIKAKEHYQLNDDKFVKLYDITTGTVRFQVVVNGALVADATQPVNERSEVKGEVTIEVLDKNFVRVIDQSVQQDGTQLNINQIVKADIKKGLTGKVKSISISKDEYLALYQEVLERNGINQLRALNIDTEEASISTSLNASGLTCEAEQKSLSCIVNVDMKLNITAKE